MAQSETSGEAESGTHAPGDEAAPPHWKRNFAANFLDVAFFSTGLAFASLTTIIPLFIRQLGGSTLLVGLVPAIIQTGWLLPPLFAAPFIARLDRKLPYILRMTLGERLPWLLLALGTYFLGLEFPSLLLALAIVLLAIFGLSGGLTMPAWMDMVANVTPMRMRGKLFGWSGALGGLLGVGGGLLAEKALAEYPFPLNFALCFLGAGICMFISYAALMALREPAGHTASQAVGVHEYVRRLPTLMRKDYDFSLFIAARILMTLGSMGVALVAVYAAEQRGLPESLAGRFTAWMLGTQVVTTPIWGMLGDRYGHKGALQFGVASTVLAMAAALVVATPAGFYAVFALIGAGTGILFTTNLNLVVEFAPPEERVTYIGLHGTLVAPATLISPLLGGWLAEVAGYGVLFTVAACCGVLRLAILSFLVRDPRHRQIARMAPGTEVDAVLPS